MNRIVFSEMWDKLVEPTFTTIRSYRPEKEEYYRSQIGKTLIIWHRYKTGRSVWNGHKVGTATLRRVSVIKPGDLPAEELRKDVLRNWKVDDMWLSRLCAMDRALLLEFDNHVGLMAERGRA